jgi:hypothetical protein
LAFHLKTSTKKGFYAKETQRQLGHKRYQPIWHLVHKIRACMGMRDDSYTLCGTMELDEGFLRRKFLRIKRMSQENEVVVAKVKQAFW